MSGWPNGREAVRDESIKQIKALLANGPMSAHDLDKVVAVHRNTLYGHLEHMHKVLRIAHPIGFRNRSMVWQLGVDPALPPLIDSTAKRDPLVAALFGPANQEYKETA